MSLFIKCWIRASPQPTQGTTCDIDGRMWSGGYFFTVNLAERKRTLLVDYVDHLRLVMKKVKTKYPFNID